MARRLWTRTTGSWMLVGAPAIIMLFVACWGSAGAPSVGLVTRFVCVVAPSRLL